MSGRELTGEKQKQGILCVLGATGQRPRARAQSRMPPSQAEHVEAWGGAGRPQRRLSAALGVSWQQEVEGEALASNREKVLEA